MEHVIHLRAYERKAELGGGFRGSVSKLTNGKAMELDKHQSEVFSTFEQAKAWAQQKAHVMMGERPYRRAYIKSPRNLYRANIWA